MVVQDRLLRSSSCMQFWLCVLLILVLGARGRVPEAFVAEPEPEPVPVGPLLPSHDGPAPVGGQSTTRSGSLSSSPLRSAPSDGGAPPSSDHADDSLSHQDQVRLLCCLQEVVHALLGAGVELRLRSSVQEVEHDVRYSEEDCRSSCGSLERKLIVEALRQLSVLPFVHETPLLPFGKSFPPLRRVVRAEEWFSGDSSGEETAMQAAHAEDTGGGGPGRGVRQPVEAFSALPMIGEPTQQNNRASDFARADRKTTFEAVTQQHPLSNKSALRSRNAAATSHGLAGGGPLSSLVDRDTIHPAANARSTQVRRTPTLTELGSSLPNPSPQLEWKSHRHLHLDTGVPRRQQRRSDETVDSDDSEDTANRLSTGLQVGVFGCFVLALAVLLALAVASCFRSGRRGGAASTRAAAASAQSPARGKTRSGKGRSGR